MILFQNIAGAATERRFAGIATPSAVAFSADGGRSWSDARLGRDLGKYSFRTWTAPFKPATRGLYSLKVRAVNRKGETQPMDATWNPAGYMRNVVETVNVSAV